MAEQTITADPVESSGKSIEDELDELDAILAEVNASEAPSDSGSDQEAPTEADAETSPSAPEASDETIATEASPVDAEVESLLGQADQSDTEDITETPQIAEAPQIGTENVAEAPADEEQERPTSNPVTEEAASPEPSSTITEGAPTADEVETNEAAPDAEAVSELVPPEPVSSRVVDVLSWPLVAALTLLDKPFASVSIKVKTVLGYIAIATMMMAAATWVLADVIR